MDRDQLLTKENPRKVMAAVLAHREVALLLSDDISQSMARGSRRSRRVSNRWQPRGSPAMKSFQPKVLVAPVAISDTAPSDTSAEADPMPCNSQRHRDTEVDFKGEKRFNAAHASATDLDARLYKKSHGTGAMISTALATMIPRLGLWIISAAQAGCHLC
ncbi:MAG: hypothetical protein EA407_12955 [Rhodobacteraceae bacterium]|nr:MAG: hypothetical protein EA407_12955 [Paracoccaceae bacterium]